MRDHKPRAPKSQEYKQVIGLLILVLAVASVSFALGVAVGKRSQVAVVLSEEVGGGEKVAAAPNNGAGSATAEDAPKVNLTFYDTLPKGEETPLGSGINPAPAEEQKAAPVDAKSEAIPEVSPPKKAKRTPEKSTPEPPATTSGEYVVQVASFQSEPDARLLQTRLLSKGHRAFLQRVDLAEKGVWTRVYIGFFNSKDAAKGLADRLAAEDKLSPMVRRR